MDLIKRFFRYIFLGGCVGNLVGFVLLSLLLGSCFLGILLAAGRQTKATDVYQLTLAEVRRNETVQGYLGQPIEDGWLVTEDFDEAGRANLIFPVYGPDASGTIYATALRVGITWQLEALFLEVDGELIPLLPDPGGGES